MTGHRRSNGVPFDAALAQRLKEAHWTRREFMARVAAFGLTAALTQLLVACGRAGSGRRASSSPTRSVTLLAFIRSTIRVWSIR